MLLVQRLATLPTIEELKIPTTTGVAYLPDTKETKLIYLFKFGHTPRLESRFVDYWVKKLNVKKVAFLARDDAWGHSDHRLSASHPKVGDGPPLFKRLAFPQCATGGALPWTL